MTLYATRAGSRPALLAAISLALTLNSAQALAAQMPTQEQMWAIIQQQQQTIDELKSRLDKTDEQVSESEEKIELVTHVVEEQGSSTSTASSWAERTSVGGYGELHYNKLEQGDGVDVDDEVDFHRFVLYFGHEFTDRVRFFSELELEHSLAGDGKAGEVELEQAWVEMDLNERHRVRAGLDIIPVGLINFTHEPNTFYGVERNNVEKNIIPSTWWEAGIGLLGELAPGWSYDAVLHSGLSIEGNSKFRVRDGRRKVSEAPAEAGAATARLRYTGVPGLELGLTAQYQGDITQDDVATGGGAATLIEGHIDYRHASGFGIRALVAQWNIDEEINAVSGSDQQEGLYIEPAYRFPLTAVLTGEAGVFARYSYWDNQAGDSSDTQFEQYTVGLNYWPVPNVVFKFDYQQQSHASAANERDGFNLGIGYQF